MIHLERAAGDAAEADDDATAAVQRALLDHQGKRATACWLLLPLLKLKTIFQGLPVHFHVCHICAPRPSSS